MFRRFFRIFLAILFVGALSLLLITSIQRLKGDSHTIAQLKGDTNAFVESARKSDLDAVDAFLAKGVDPNWRNKDGETALVAASSEDRYEVVRLLLARGAAVDARSLGRVAFGVDATFSLYSYPHPTWDYICGLTLPALHEQFSKLDKLGTTALIAAASRGHTRIVEILLDNGANIEARSYESATALMMATISNHIETMKLLIARGANVNAKADKGATPLMLAAWTYTKFKIETIEALQLIFEAGADIDAQDESGRTALIGTAVANNLRSAKFLLSKGADVNAKDKEGKTALRQAVEERNFKMRKLLLSK